MVAAPDRVLDRQPFTKSLWTTGLLKSPHHPALKRVVLDVEKDLHRATGDEAGPLPHRELKARLKHMTGVVMDAGKEWALQFMPNRAGLSKSAARLDWDVNADIDRIVRTVGEVPNQKIRDAYHEAAMMGGGAAKAVQQLARDYQVDRARDIARTVYMNVYSKAALREMSLHGYSQCRRMEIDDHKVCPLCWSKNNEIYDIAPLLQLPDPLTNDTHPRCRGSFVPVLNSMIALPIRGGKLEWVSNIKDGGNELTNVPAEYAPFLKRFARKNTLPFKVVFDPNLKVDSQMRGDTLVIHPNSLFDQDPRELILEHWGADIWPKYEDVFRNEYLTLTAMGLVRPSKTVRTTKDYWISEFTSWKLSQMDTPWEYIWFLGTVKEPVLTQEKK